MILRKLDRHLHLALARHSPEEKLPVIVSYRRDKVSPKTLLPDVEAKHLFSLIPAIAVTLPLKALDALSEDPRVEKLWYDQTVRALLDVSVPLIEVPKIWEAGYDGSEIKVGIIDTGVDATHPDLAGRIRQTTDLTGEGSGDTSGHGTHVAGIIAGTGAASGGAYRGVAPGAQLFVVKVLRSDGSGVMSDTIAGLEWLIGQGVHIINISLGAPPPGDGTDPLSQACDAAVLKGFVICVAAGNDGPSEGTVGPPGCASQVITVGASTKMDSVATFSSRGPTSDGRNKPDFLMPGEGIVSCRARGTSVGKPVNELYTALSGSSMAAPHASGVAALLLQAKPSLTPRQIKDVLTATALDLGWKASIQGAGRARAYKAFTTEAVYPIPKPSPSKRKGCLSLPLAPLLK